MLPTKILDSQKLWRSFEHSSSSLVSFGCGSAAIGQICLFLRLSSLRVCVTSSRLWFTRSHVALVPLSLVHEIRDNVRVIPGHVVFLRGIVLEIEKERRIVDFADLAAKLDLGNEMCFPCPFSDRCQLPVNVVVDEFPLALAVAEKDRQQALA